MYIRLLILRLKGVYDNKVCENNTNFIELRDTFPIFSRFTS